MLVCFCVVLLGACLAFFWCPVACRVAASLVVALSWIKATGRSKAHQGLVCAFPTLDMYVAGFPWLASSCNYSASIFHLAYHSFVDQRKWPIGVATGHSGGWSHGTCYKASYWPAQTEGPQQAACKGYNLPQGLQCHYSARRQPCCPAGKLHWPVHLSNQGPRD